MTTSPIPDPGAAALQRTSRPPSKLKEAVEPRPDTTGDLACSSPMSAAVGGGIQGFFSGGPAGALGGAVGGYVGVKTGEVTKGFHTALVVGGLAGAATATAAAVGMAALAGAPFLAAAAVPMAMIGTLAGVSGTISGGRKARTRDGAIGGFMFGSLSRIFVPGLLNGLVAGVAGGMGARFSNKTAGAIVAGLTGTVLGALTGLPGGLHSAMLGAIIGGGAGVAGTVAGPKMQQVQRNLTSDMKHGLEKKIEPIVDHAGTAGLMAIASLGGAISMAPMAVLAGMVFGPVAAAVPLALGAGAVAYNMYKMKKHRDEAKAAQQQPVLPPAETTATLVASELASQPPNR